MALGKKIYTVFYFVSTTFLFAQNMSNKNFAIVLHGGAGTILKENMTPELEKEYLAKLDEALEKGYNTLEKGGTSADAVVAAIVILEDSPLFNAGKGSVFTHEGKNEMDASIMDGKTLKAGAAAKLTKVKNPIIAARCILEKSPHVMMVGEGAEEFAKSCGCEFADSAYFYTETRYKQLLKAIESETIELDHGLDKKDPALKDKKHGTVGVVALDVYGNICAGTSTGGMTNKKHGRIGDSPIIGAGTYANNKTCGVSCTGHGEYFIRAVVAYDVSALMEYKGYSLEKAANEVVNKKLKEMEGEGGLVALDAKGNITMPFNTAGMYRAYKKSSGQKEILIYK
jgi:beta-aspartyl-peptidase (threonine type)